MRIYDIIRKKRDGESLSDAEIEFFVRGASDGSVSDYQLSALLMAIYFKGMSDDETSALTSAMAVSGDTVDLSGIDGFTVDKHSTGGVGDKTTLVVAPIVAACGGRVAKMSGRGLGHTGGTVDKLESFEGFKTELDRESFINQVNEIGISVIGQSGNIAPADKKLYALRDVTATVDSIPLIASSIMSKKLAAGSKGFVLDVKTGSGAFMKTPDEAERLADEMVRIGKAAGRKVTAIITDMDVPLGNAVGNSLEVIEAIETLKGRGSDDFRTVCFELAANMLMLVNGRTHDENMSLVHSAVADGSALEKLRKLVEYQGGDPRWVDDTELFPKAAVAFEIKSEKSGYISHMDAEKIGIASMILGAGREKKEDSIDHSAGIILRKKTGDRVEAGDVLAVLYTNDETKLGDSGRSFLSALEYTDSPIKKQPLVYKTITG